MPSPARGATTASGRTDTATIASPFVGSTAGSMCVVTPEGVLLEFRPSGIATRAMGRLIDLLIMGVGFWLTSLVLVLIAGSVENWVVIATFVALSGPAFDTVTVKVTFSPTFGVASLTVLARERSAAVGVNSMLAKSSSVVTPLFGDESGSNWSEAVISAVLV